MNKGDIFVTFPAMPYYITNDDSLKMMYITFLGTRAYQILDQINITKTNNIRHNNFNLIKLWDSVFDNVNNVTSYHREGSSSQFQLVSEMQVIDLPVLFAKK